MPNKRPLYIGAKKLKKKMDNFSVRPQKESHDTLLVILVLIIIENFYYKHTMTNQKKKNSMRSPLKYNK